MRKKHILVSILHLILMVCLFLTFYLQLDFIDTSRQGVVLIIISVWGTIFHFIRIVELLKLSKQGRDFLAEDSVNFMSVLSINLLLNRNHMFTSDVLRVGLLDTVYMTEFIVYFAISTFYFIDLIVMIEQDIADIDDKEGD